MTLLRSLNTRVRRQQALALTLAGLATALAQVLVLAAFTRESEAQVASVPLAIVVTLTFLVLGSSLTRQVASRDTCGGLMLGVSVGAPLFGWLSWLAVVVRYDVPGRETAVLALASAVIACCLGLSVLLLVRPTRDLDPRGLSGSRLQFAVAFTTLILLTAAVTQFVHAPRMILVPALGWLAIAWPSRGASYGSTTVSLGIVLAVATGTGRFDPPPGPEPALELALAVVIVCLGVHWLGLITRERNGALLAAKLDRDRLASTLRTSERDNQLLSNLPGMVYRTAAIDDWTAEYISTGAGEVIGYTPEQILGGVATLATIVHPHDLQRVVGDPEVSRATGQPFSHVYRIHHGSGEIRWVAERGRVVEFEGRRVLEGFIADVTDKRRTELQSRSHAAVLARALAGEDVDMIVSDACKDFIDTWGVTSVVLSHFDEVAGRRELTATTEEGGSAELVWNFSQSISLTSGAQIVLIATAPREPDEELRIAVIRLVQLMAMLEEHRAARRDLEYSATHDWLGIANRRSAADAVSGLLDNCQSGKSHGVVFSVDLVRFGYINSTFGHESGDTLLIAVRDRLQQVAGISRVARIGGAEFITIADLQVADGEVSRRLAKELKAAVETPFQLGRQLVRLGARVGYTSCEVTEGAPGMDELPPLVERDLIDEAQLARTTAVTSANEPVAFESKLRQATSRRAQLTHALQLAVESELIEVQYQPEVNLRTGRIFGVEALARWSEHGESVSAEEFIPIAEESGLIGPLGSYVLDRALRDLSGWETLVSVNVSALQLGDTHFIAEVASTMERTGIDPRWVCIEVTESAIRETEVMRMALMGLKSLGVTIAIDDFGTGYSSLSELTRLPLDILKIDRSFVSRLGKSSVDDTVVSTMFALAKGLGLRVIAEGVETQEQEASLLDMGCDVVQGWRYSSSISGEQLPRLLKAWNHGA